MTDEERALLIVMAKALEELIPELPAEPTRLYNAFAAVSDALRKLPRPE